MKTSTVDNDQSNVGDDDGKNPSNNDHNNNVKDDADDATNDDADDATNDDADDDADNDDGRNHQSKTKLLCFPLFEALADVCGENFILFLLRKKHRKSWNSNHHSRQISSQNSLPR